MRKLAKHSQAYPPGRLWAVLAALAFFFAQVMAAEHAGEHGFEPHSHDEKPCQIALLGDDDAIDLTPVLARPEFEREALLRGEQLRPIPSNGGFLPPSRAPPEAIPHA